MSAKIKNYTSSVPASRTISLIELELVKIGVTHIEKSYDMGEANGIIFSITMGKKFSFKLPAKILEAYDIIKLIPEYKNKKVEWLEAQARRTAWKIILNWVEAQVAMIQLNQAEAMQIFMPYIYDSKSGQTFYEKIRDNNFKLLE